MPGVAAALWCEPPRVKDNPCAADEKQSAEAEPSAIQVYAVILLEVYHYQKRNVWLFSS